MRVQGKLLLTRHVSLPDVNLHTLTAYLIVGGRSHPELISCVLTLRCGCLEINGSLSDFVLFCFAFAFSNYSLITCIKGGKYAKRNYFVVVFKLDRILVNL